MDDGGGDETGTGAADESALVTPLRKGDADAFRSLSASCCTGPGPALRFSLESERAE